MNIRSTGLTVTGGDSYLRGCVLKLQCQMEHIIRSRIGRFNAHVKCAQIENALSYCINACNLRRSERAIN